MFVYHIQLQKILKFIKIDSILNNTGRWLNTYYSWLFNKILIYGIIQLNLLAEIAV